MSVPVTYFPPGGAPAVEDLKVRIHTENKEAGDLQGTSLSYAQTLETEPQLLFDNTVQTPARLGVVSVDATEAYRITSIEPPDGITTTCLAERLPEAEAAALV